MSGSRQRRRKGGNGSWDSGIDGRRFAIRMYEGLECYGL